MLLCDAAQVVEGKLFLMGGGWTHSATAGQSMTMALAILIEVPWEQANQEHTLRAILLTADGEPLSQGDQAVLSEGSFEVGRPVGLRKGAPINMPFALTHSGVILDPGSYVWELEIDGATVARSPFQITEDGQ